MLKKVVRLAVAFPFSLTLLAGQTPATTPPGGPNFDVVSIKINDSGHNGGAWGERCESGRWTARNVSISDVIVTAFGLLPAQVGGLPDWDGRPLHQFDITATCPPVVAATPLGPMLQPC